MSVEDENKVDAAAISKDGKSVVLVIMDHLDWSHEGEHLLMLQNKLNAYFELIKSGGLARQMPQAKGLPVTIRTYGKFPLSKQAAKFFEMAGTEFAKDGISVEFELSDD